MGSIIIFKPLSTFLSPVPSINLSNIKINFWERQESNLGLLGEKQECYLSAMQSPFLQMLEWCCWENMIMVKSKKKFPSIFLNQTLSLFIFWKRESLAAKEMIGRCSSQQPRFEKSPNFRSWPCFHFLKITFGSGLATILRILVGL